MFSQIGRPQAFQHRLQRAIFAGLLALTAVIAAITSGCGGSGTNANAHLLGSNTTDNVVGGQVYLTLVKQSDNSSTNSVSLAEPGVLKAYVYNSAGKPVSNAVVTFSSDKASLFSFVQADSAMTDANGLAQTGLSPAGLSAAGAGNITAEVSLGTVSVSKTIGVQIGTTTVALSSVTLGSSAISAYGTTTVQANVTPATVPVTVQFSSNCAGRGLATITASAETINGVASSTFTDKGCGQQDTITAQIQGSSSAQARVQLNVSTPQIANVQFVSADPSTIVLRGTGSDAQQVATVKFRVVDQSNSPVVSPVNVKLKLSTATGGITLDNVADGGEVTKQTGANGEVSVQVRSGTIPTPVWVFASIADKPEIATQSLGLSISTGRPTQDRFSLSFEKLNIEGLNYDGVTTDVTVRAADRLGNLVPNGTVVNFISEGAAIDSQCTTATGACNVKFYSQALRPIADAGAHRTNTGRVTVVAYALGEESFVDLNGNNVFDSGETYNDLGSVYVDREENGTWETIEQVIPYNANLTAACVNPLTAYATPSKPNTCDGVWGQAHVRRAGTIVLSGSTAFFATLGSIDTYSPVGQALTLSAAPGCSTAVSFLLQDVNGNPMPAGTELLTDVASATDVTATVINNKVLSTVQRGGTLHTVQFKGALDTSVTPQACKGSGLVSVEAKTPKGVSTIIQFSISR